MAWNGIHVRDKAYAKELLDEYDALEKLKQGIAVPSMTGVPS